MSLIEQVVWYTTLLTAAMLLCDVRAQRSPYAGLRPSDGLSQIHKYNQRPATANGTGIANRFGETDNNTVNTIAFGAPQRPPVGMTVVTPQITFVPLANRPEQTPQVVVNNRIGGTDGTAVNTQTGTGATAGAGVSTAAAAGGVQQLPLDAHGDQLLIDQLNRVPEDRRPFWFLNYQAIEAQRNNSANNNFAGAIATRGHFLG